MEMMHPSLLWGKCCWIIRIHKPRNSVDSYLSTRRLIYMMLFDINYSMQYIEIEADGFTSVLTANGKTKQNEWNKIKIVVADMADMIIDSYVLLSAKSFTCVPITQPTSQPIPSSNPSSSSQPSHFSAPSEIPSLSLSPTISANPRTDEKKCMIFDTMPADELIRNIFIDTDGQVDFRNVVASNHACYLHFYNGHEMGHHKITGEQLIPQEGIILSTGKPEDFCWNDSDEMTTQWRTSGDADLTNLLQQTETYDAVSSQYVVFWFSTISLRLITVFRCSV